MTKNEAIEIMIGYIFKFDDGKMGFLVESEHEYMYDCVAYMPKSKPYKLK